MIREVEVGIIGAGIHGCALARELSLRGISCALIDQSKFAGGTSQKSTKLLHGGIRYLRTGDMDQVKEGLRERAIWQKIAPHRCYWESFWLPHTSFLSSIPHRIGIGLYDTLGSNRPNWPADLNLGKVPANEFTNDPRSQDGPFKGAVAYADLLCDDRKLTLDLAASSTALLYEHQTVIGWHKRGETLTEATLMGVDHEFSLVRASKWVFALGPWIDGTLSKWFCEEKKRLRLSAGIHIWFEGIKGCEHPWVVERPNNRVFFIIPRNGCLQVGTTEREVNDPNVAVTQPERETLYESLQEFFPAINWRSLEVVREEIGVRPLVGGEGETSSLGRGATLEQYSKFENVWLVLGGKLTTARSLMDELATQLTHQTCPESQTTPLIQYDAY